MGSVIRTLTTSFGSVCFGSLLVAILQATKAVAEAARSEEGGSFLYCIAEVSLHFRGGPYCTVENVLIFFIACISVFFNVWQISWSISTSGLLYMLAYTGIRTSRLERTSLLFSRTEDGKLSLQMILSKMSSSF